MHWNSQGGKKKGKKIMMKKILKKLKNQLKIHSKGFLNLTSMSHQTKAGITEKQK